MKPQLWSALIFVVGAMFGAMADRLVVMSAGTAQRPPALGAADKTEEPSVPKLPVQGIVAEKATDSLTLAIGGLPGSGMAYLVLRVVPGTVIVDKDGMNRAFEDIRRNDLVEFVAPSWTGDEQEVAATKIIVVLSPGE
jgi:hypothetical protein